MTLREEVKHNMLNQLKHFATSLMARVRVAEETGQAMVEYSLILVLVSIAAIAVLPGLGEAIVNVFEEVTAAF